MRDVQDGIPKFKKREKSTPPAAPGTGFAGEEKKGAPGARPARRGPLFFALQSKKNLREKKGISQEVVSSFAGIGRTHLSAIERGQRKPTLETFFRLSEALGMAASDLMREIEKEIQKENDKQEEK